MTPRSSARHAIGLLLLAQALGVVAQQPEASDEIGVSPFDAESENLVSLLEFIGEFSTDDGEWVDPDILLETEIPGLGRSAEPGAADGDDASVDPNERCADSRCE